MAGGEPAGEKTEAPSEKRLRDAAAKGDRPDLRDAGVALVVVLGALWLMFAGRALVDALSGGLVEGLIFTRAELDVFDPARTALRLLMRVGGPLSGLFAVTIAGAVGAALIGGAGRPAWGRLAPDPKRMDPLAGLGRMFGTQGLTELGKSLLKVVVCGGVAFFALRTLDRDALALAAADPQTALHYLGGRAAHLFLLLSGGLLLIALAGSPLAYLRWLNRLRMTKQEVREEAKEQEGSPELKAAQRRRQREAARAGTSAAVKTADVVITNPTHFAVALRYRRAQDLAPVVVARGKGELAQMIRAAAREHGVPVLDYPDLARALYFTSRRDSEIAPDLYVAVAAVLAFVFSLARPGARPKAPVVDVPETLRFDEHGRRIR